MPPKIVFRISPLMLLIRAMFALMAAAFVVSVSSSWQPFAVTNIVVLAAILLTPALFIQCTVTDHGLSVRNYFRTHRVAWSDIGSVENARPLMLVWAGDFPRLTLKSGKSFSVRAVQALRESTTQRFCERVEAEAQQHGFDTHLTVALLSA